MLTAAEPSTTERRFADLPFTQSWQAIVTHLDSLDGAASLSFLMGDDEDPRTQLIFIFRRNLFRLVSDNDRVALSVADANCPDRVATAVLRHFAWLLSPGFVE